jgi:hypothetical protein
MYPHSHVKPYADIRKNAFRNELDMTDFSYGLQYRAHDTGFPAMFYIQFWEGEDDWRMVQMKGYFWSTTTLTLHCLASISALRLDGNVH